MVEILKFRRQIGNFWQILNTLENPGNFWLQSVSFSGSYWQAEAVIAGLWQSMAVYVSLWHFNTS